MLKSLLQKKSNGTLAPVLNPINEDQEALWYEVQELIGKEDVYWIPERVLEKLQSKFILSKKENNG